MSRPSPAKAIVANSMARTAVAAEPAGCQPRRAATPMSTATWMTSTARMAMVLAARSAGRPRGVAPSRLSTPYWRSKPVAMPRPTMAVDITARARMPGARKSTGSFTPTGRMSTDEKNTRSRTGMIRVSSTDSPRRSVSTSSTRVCAASAFIWK